MTSDQKLIRMALDSIEDYPKADRAAGFLVDVQYDLVGETYNKELFNKLYQSLKGN